MKNNPEQNKDMKQLMRADDAFYQYRITQIFQQGTYGVGHGPQQQVLDKAKTEPAIEHDPGQCPHPTHAQIQGETEPFDNVPEKNAFQGDAGDCDDPDKKQDPPAQTAGEQQAVNGRKRPRDEEENTRMIEALQDRPGRTPGFQQVIDTAHRQQEHNGKAEHTQRKHPSSMPSTTAHYYKAQHKKDAGGKQVSDGAERLAESRDRDDLIIWHQ